MEKTKKSKGLIWLIIILVILVIGLVSYIVYEKNVKIEYLTEEEIIKQNLLKDIKIVKKGKGTEKQKYLLCDDTYNCENIDKFYIDDIEFYEINDDNEFVYKIKLSWSCKGEGECFYNEQYGYNDETKLNEIETFYKVDEKNEIIECLGNLYGFTEKNTNYTQAG